ncbi:MAG: hypothetical protein KDI07_02730 [Anaerolineae bacterium]|nr:hypothetical protein [Anaerolineae bacterium]
MRSMIEWLRTTGSPAPEWVAWARSVARRLYLAGDRTQKQMILSDGTLIYIQFVDENAYILVDGGAGGSYQFIGSLDHLYKTFDDDNLPAGTRYLPLVYAVHAEVKGGAWKATPLVSSGEDVPTDPAPAKTWTYDPDPRNTDDHLVLSPAHQWDGMGMHQWFNPTDDAPKRNIPWLMTQWQQGNPLGALGWFSAGSTARWVSGDYGYDFGPTLFAGTGLAGVNKTPDSDWYGRACIHRTEDGRVFIIMVDINSKFYCYPTTGYGDEYIPGGAVLPGERANVPTSLTQSQDCPWPVWVTVENLGEAAYDEPISLSEQQTRLRTLWSFNQAGTRAACIAAHRDEPWADAYFTSSSYEANGAFYQDNKEDYPGLVEVEFTVEVTGPGDGDFTFSVALAQSIYSKTDQRCPVAVGYTMRESGGVPLDSLVMLEYLHYTDCPAMAVEAITPDDPGPPTLYQPRRPNKATIASVQVQDGIGGWSEIARWLTYYACYPTKVRLDQEPRKFSPIITDFVGVPPGANSEDYFHNHFTYIANILSLDLSALSWNIGVSVFTQGTVPSVSGDTWAVEAGAIITTVWGTEKVRRTIGNTTLKTVASDMYDLTHQYPNMSEMTQFHLNATADYVYYDTGTGFSADNIYEYATLNVTDGAGGTWSNVIQDACEPSWQWNPYQLATTLFPAATDIRGPRIHGLWDGWPVVRPGIRWRDSGGWKPGTLSFSDYPYAAVHHAMVWYMTTTTLYTVQQALKVHRNGSWSVFAGPFAAHTSVMKASEDIPNDFEQTIVDVVSLTTDSTQKDSVTTHVSLMNQAFSKELTAEDYYFEFRKTGFGVAPEFRPASDDPTVHPWYGVTTGGVVGILWPIQFIIGLHVNGNPYDRPLCDFCFDGNFVLIDRYASYSQQATFPNPRMECAFIGQ